MNEWLAYLLTDLLIYLFTYLLTFIANTPKKQVSTHTPLIYTELLNISFALSILDTDLDFTEKIDTIESSLGGQNISIKVKLVGQNI